MLRVESKEDNCGETGDGEDHGNTVVDNLQGEKVGAIRAGVRRRVSNAEEEKLKPLKKRRLSSSSLEYRSRK